MSYHLSPDGGELEQMVEEMSDDGPGSPKKSSWGLLGKTGEVSVWNYFNSYLWESFSHMFMFMLFRFKHLADTFMECEWTLFKTFIVELAAQLG